MDLVNGEMGEAMEKRQPDTRLFISQSKERAREFALALKDFLALVVHGSDPWVSEGGIEPGAKFPKEIDYNLATSLAGIICVTPENQNEPWLLFEAGALSQKSHELVWILLLDLERGVLQRPIGDFQQTLATDRKQMFDMIKSINGIVGGRTGRAQRENELERLFDAFWEKDLKPVIDDLIANPPADRPSEPTERELMKELLREIRDRRVDSWRIAKTQLLLGDLYRHVLGKAAPGMKELAATPNVSPEEGSGSIRILVPTGTLTIGNMPPSASTSPWIASTQMFSPSVSQEPRQTASGDSNEKK